MFRPSTKDIHDETMFEFCEIFNNSEIYKDIVMSPHFPKETYVDDGVFEDVKTGQKLRFDWAYNDSSIFEKDGKFKYEKISVFDRKKKKGEGIQIVVQCDKNLNWVAAVWQKDYSIGERVQRTVKKDSGHRIDFFWETAAFRTYSFNNVEYFKSMIAHAIKFQTYSSKIFEIMDNKIYKTKSIEENNQMVFPDWAM